MKSAGIFSVSDTDFTENLTGSGNAKIYRDSGNRYHNSGLQLDVFKEGGA